MLAGRHEDLVRHRRWWLVRDAILISFCSVFGLAGLIRGLWGWAVFTALVVLADVVPRRRHPELIVARIRAETLELQGLVHRYRIDRADVLHVGFGNGTRSAPDEQPILWWRDFADPVAANPGRARFVVIELRASERSRGRTRFAVPTSGADAASAFVAELKRWATPPSYRAQAYREAADGGSF